MLNFFQFEILEEDDFSLTLEAMASVHPSRWPAVLDEAEHLLKAVGRSVGTAPGPLDNGHSWDIWVQYQAGQHAAPATLSSNALPTVLQSLANPLLSSDWLTLTLTLTVLANEADSIRALLLP